MVPIETTSAYLATERILLPEDAVYDFLKHNLFQFCIFIIDHF